MSKRKQNNMNKRFSIVAKGAIKDLAMAFVDGNKAHIVSTKHKCKVRASETMINAFLRVPHKWTVYVAVICRDWQGRTYTKAIEVSPTVPCLHSTLADQLIDIHAELIDSVNDSDLIARAWIASPHGYSFSEAEALECFETIGIP